MAEWVTFTWQLIPCGSPHRKTAYFDPSGAKILNWFWWNLAWLTLSRTPSNITTLVAVAQREWSGQICDISHLGVFSFFTALHGMQTRSSDENSVRPSVRLSVRDKTVERSVHIYIPYERTFSLVFW